MNAVAIPPFKLKPSMNPYLADFWVADARNYVLHGGRASSKSWDCAAFCVFLAVNYKVRFLCTRQFQNKLSESVYTLIKGQAERFGLAHLFNFTKAGIEVPHTGSEFLFYGLARNIDEIKSLEDVDVLWIEEGQNLTPEQWEILEPTIRKEGSRVFIVFNPQFASDFVYKRFVTNPPPRTIVRQINHNNNPFLSKTMRDIIEAAKGEDYDSYLHVYEGVPKSDSDKVLIKRAWLLACVDADKKLNRPGMRLGRKQIGFDVADDGRDLCANVAMHGSVIVFAEEWKGLEDQILKSSARTYTNARLFGAKIMYDCIGVGAHAGSKFAEMNEDLHAKVKFESFNAAGKVPDPDQPYVEDGEVVILRGDFFCNAKAVAWVEFSDRARKTWESVTLGAGARYEDDELLSLDSSLLDDDVLEKLIDELSGPYRDHDKNGKMKVESKDDMMERGLVSPNMADACIMASWGGEHVSAGWFDQ